MSEAPAAEHRASHGHHEPSASGGDDFSGYGVLSPPRMLWGAFIALWVFSLLWYGAVSPGATALMAAGTALLWIASVFFLPNPVGVSGSATVTFLAMSAVVTLQLVPLPPGLFPYTDALRVRHGVAGSGSGTGDLYLTVRQLAQIGAYILAGVFVKRLVGAGLRRWDVVISAVLVLAFEGIYAVAQVGFSFEEIPFYGLRHYQDCASGTLVNRNHFAGMIAMGLAMASGAAWYRLTSTRLSGKLRIRAGIPWAFAAALFAACVVMSKSRGGTLAAAAGLLAIPFLVRRRVRSASITGVVLLAALAVAAAFFSNIEPMVERFEEIDADRIQSDTRVLCWKSSLVGWNHQPVLGFGIGSYPETFRPFQPPSLPGQFQHAHNEYVNALFEGGIAWLAVLLLGFALWLWFSLRGLRRLEGSERAAAASCIAAVLAIATHSCTDFDLRITSIGLLFAAAMGASLPRASGVRPVPRLPAAALAIVAASFAIPLGFADLEPEGAARIASTHEPAKAEVALAAVLRRSPFNPVAASYQALQAESRGDLSMAAIRLQTATDLWPSNPLLQRDAALWFLDHDDLPRATVCFRRFFEQRPSSVAATITPRWSVQDPVAPWEPCMPTPMAVAHFASYLARLNRWQDAAGVFERGVPAEEDYAWLYDRLANSFQDAGQWGLEAAIRDRRIQIRSEPVAYAAAAAAWSRVEAWDKALEYARIAIKIDPGKVDWQATLAEILDMKGNSMEAIEALTAALRSKPDRMDLRFRRAGIYYKEQLHQFAIEDYRAVVKASPTDREAVFGLVAALTDAGKKIEALGEIDAWVSEHPDDLEAIGLRSALRK